MSLVINYTHWTFLMTTYFSIVCIYIITFSNKSSTTRNLQKIVPVFFFLKQFSINCPSI